MSSIIVLMYYVMPPLLLLHEHNCAIYCIYNISKVDMEISSNMFDEV